MPFQYFCAREKVTGMNNVTRVRAPGREPARTRQSRPRLLIPASITTAVNSDLPRHENVSPLFSARTHVR